MMHGSVNIKSQCTLTKEISSALKIHGITYGRIWDVADHLRVLWYYDQDGCQERTLWCKFIRFGGKIWWETSRKSLFLRNI